ncbi:MAG: trypsin-like peptidase domain-containing protein [Planctomycetaceae bacterium]|nr:trypsin-like peptidase domain-containing protein [Planctomycetaceae bacterium]
MTQPPTLAKLRLTLIRHPFRLVLLVCLIAGVASPAHALTPAPPESRMTPIVRAVARVKSATVNIHSEKLAKQTDSLFSTNKDRKINGMGTGIILDERGYIVTNHHVVNGVDSLRVTLVDGAAYMARVVSFDSKHDLAIIKIDPNQKLDVMVMGTSSDLMLGEDVLAIGNAFGYEHTVTRGIISALSRDVEVNEEQAYENLIQIDAAINPGNSGGPLLNRDGEVIGINVAIRAGAQKIGFAIPIDDARQVIARLLNIERLDNNFHGLQAQDFKQGKERRLIVSTTSPGSPAALAGMMQGDVVEKVEAVDVVDMADFERGLLGHRGGETVNVTVRRGEEQKNLQLTIASMNRRDPMIASRQTVQQSSSQTSSSTPSVNEKSSWEMLGLRLQPLASTERSLVNPRYRGGMKVTSVRHESPAAQNGIREGDILVGLHVWETITPENIEFVIEHPQLNTFNPLKFYILRGKETLYGYLQVSGR